jgi:hypothetical protein
MNVEYPCLAAELPEPWRPTLGRDFAAYGNHGYQICNFCAALAGDAPDAEGKIAIAAACHDLGIWSDRTFDYLPHSIRLARAHLAETGRSSWSDEVVAMIAEHHKITPYRGHAGKLVEPFRKADLIDLSPGMVKFGLDRRFVREVRTRFPNNGFHKRLAELSIARIRSHPTDPLPMMKR